MKASMQLSQPWWQKINRQLSGSKDLSLGIDRGTSAVRYVLVNRDKNQIVQWGSYEKEANSRDDASLSLEGKETKSPHQVLKDIALNIPKNRIGIIHTNLRDPAAVMGFLEVTLGSALEVDEQVKGALREKIPFALDEAVYFYRRCAGESDHGKSAKQGGGKKGESTTYNFVAVPRNVIENTVHPIEDVFSMIPEVSPEGYAQECLVEKLQLAVGDEPIAFISVGRSTTVIAIFLNNQMVFEREIPLAGQDLTRSILILYPKEHTPRSSFDLSIAEKLKKEAAIPIQGAVLTAEQQKIFQTIEGVFTAWFQDVKLSFQFFNEHYGAKKISKIYLMGGGVNMKNLPSYLEQELGIPTQIIHFPDKNVLSLPAAPDPNIFKKQFHEYITALSLALQPPGHSNLKISATKTDYLEKIGKIAFRVGSVLIFAFLLTWYSFVDADVKALKDIKNSLNNQRGFLEKVEKPYLEMLDWEKFLRAASGSNLPASQIFKIIGRRIPPNVILSRVIIDRQQSTLVMEGYVYGDAKNRAIIVEEFTKSLKNTGYFEKIEVPVLSGVQIKHQGKGDLAAFRLTGLITRLTDQNKRQV